MHTEKRKSSRFNINIFIEFKQLKDATQYFLGLTRNFSYEGLSVESANFDFKPRENLEFKVKHPQDNYFVSFMGDIVWKVKTDTKSFAGIKFREISKKNKNKLQEIISDSSTVPEAPFIYSRNQNKFMKDKSGKISQSRIWFYTTVMAVAVFILIFTYPERTGEFQKKSKIVIADIIKSVTNKFIDKMENKAVIEEVQNQDTIMHEPFKSLQLPATGSSESNELNKIRKRILEEDRLSNHKQQLKKPEINQKITARPEKIKTQKKVPALKQSLTAEDAAAGNKYYIQVASLENPRDADNMLFNLKKYYPDVYIFKDNNLYTVRIPNIKTKTEGDILLKNLEKKFQLKPVLVPRIQ